MIGPVRHRGLLSAAVKVPEISLTFRVIKVLTTVAVFGTMAADAVHVVQAVLALSRRRRSTGAPA